MARAKDIILNTRINFTLGDPEDNAEGSSKRFTIHELPIGRNEEWTDKVIDLFSKLSDFDTDDLKTDPDSTDKEAEKAKLMGTLQFAYKQNPRGFINLIYDYSEDIADDRGWVEEHATPTQLFEMIKIIMEKALPFLLRVQELTPGA